MPATTIRACLGRVVSIQLVKPPNQVNNVASLFPVSSGRPWEGQIGFYTSWEDIYSSAARSRARPDFKNMDEKEGHLSIRTYFPKQLTHGGLDVILNDEPMKITKPVGAMSLYLT